MIEIVNNVKGIEKKVKQDEVFYSNENGSITIKDDGTIKIKTNHLPSPLKRIEELEIKIDELESSIKTIQDQLNLKVDKHRIIEAFGY